MPSRHSARATSLWLCVLSGWMIVPAGGRAQEIPPPSAAVIAEPGAARDLQLEVFINGTSTGMIANFRQGAREGLAIEPDQLRNIGLLPAREAELPDGLIAIEKLPGVGYTYDEATQCIYFEGGADVRAARQIDASGGSQQDQAEKDTPKPASNFGALVNYTLYASSGGEAWTGPFDFPDASSEFETRLVGPLGVVSSTQFVSLSGGEDVSMTRLDTSWSYSDPERLIDYRLGDIITGGLSWTRPTRLGGVRIARNFDLRPDLVTMPLPSLAGSAAVPSTVDVYIDRTRRLSQEVDAGPFSINNLPVVTGSGTARLVVRDALGRETVSETPFYNSSELLSPGLWDFSGEAGFARLSYGTLSNDYDDRLMGSFTVRRGITDRFTLEGHAEGGLDLQNGGIGAVFGLGNLGVGTASIAASRHDGKVGTQITASLETELRGTQIFARSQRTFGDYNDIASITVPSRAAVYLPNITAKPPRALDQVAVAVPLNFDETTLNFSFTRLETAGNEVSSIVGSTASRPIGENGNIFVTAYTDLERKNAFGMFAGLSWSFGGGRFGSTGVSSSDGGTTVISEFAKAEQAEVGSSGWRVRDSEGENSSRAVSASYRAPFGRMEAGIEQSGNALRGSAQLDGAVVLSGGDVFVSNRVDDAFAIVDAGAPGVDVQIENRPVGKTNGRGKLLLPNLRAYQSNKITIDPSALPIDASIDSTREVVMPSDRGGVVVDFNVKTDVKAQRLTLRTEAGAYVEAGATAHFGDGDQDFIVGYDGEAYVTGLGRTNSLVVEQPTFGRCQADFDLDAAQTTKTHHEIICRAIP